jgi:hypothetical protein
MLPSASWSARKRHRTIPRPWTTSVPDPTYVATLESKSLWGNPSRSLVSFVRGLLMAQGRCGRVRVHQRTKRKASSHGLGSPPSTSESLNRPPVFYRSLFLNVDIVAHAHFRLLFTHSCSPLMSRASSGNTSKATCTVSSDTGGNPRNSEASTRMERDTIPEPSQSEGAAAASHESVLYRRVALPNVLSFTNSLRNTFQEPTATTRPRPACNAIRIAAGARWSGT